VSDYINIYRQFLKNSKATVLKAQKYSFELLDRNYDLEPIFIEEKVFPNETFNVTKCGFTCNEQQIKIDSQWRKDKYMKENVSIVSCLTEYLSHNMCSRTGKRTNCFRRKQYSSLLPKRKKFVLDT